MRLGTSRKSMSSATMETKQLPLTGAPKQLEKLHISSIEVDDVEINSIDHVGNLGIFDKRYDYDKKIQQNVS